MRKVLGIIGIIVGIAVIGFGIYLDISQLLVGGIEEVIRGAQATPVSGHDIAFGLVRFFCSGVATMLAIILGGSIIGGSSIVLRD